jgi:hypothetical protein
MSNFPTIKAKRTQLYSMAAVSTYGTHTQLIIKATNSKDVLCAVKMRDTCPKQQLKDRHKNGYAYYLVSEDGVIKPLTEKELRKIP